jgi:hypothetical protein
MPNQYTFTLEIATAMFAKTLGNFQHLVQLIPESQSYTLQHCGYVILSMEKFPS